MDSVVILLFVFAYNYITIRDILCLWNNPKEPSKMHVPWAEWRKLHPHHYKFHAFNWSTLITVNEFSCLIVMGNKQLVVKIVGHFHQCLNTINQLRPLRQWGSWGMLVLPKTWFIITSHWNSISRLIISINTMNTCGQCDAQVISSIDGVN